MSLAPTLPAVPWSMPPLVRASVVLHGAAVAALLLAPAGWPWVVAALLIDHALLTATGLWPRSSALGPNITRLPPQSAQRSEVAITIDDGPEPSVTPAVLDLLEANGAKATFFCIASRVQQHPELAREILSRGHGLENHSYRHRHTFSMLGPRGFFAEIDQAQQAIFAATGHRPLFFRAPAGLRNPFLDPVLHRLGLRLASWTRRGFDTRESDPQVVLRRLTRGLAAGDILLLHDGHARPTAQGRPVILEVLPGLLQACREARLACVTLSQAFSG